MPFDVRNLLINCIYIGLVILLLVLIYYIINIGNKNLNEDNRITISLHNIKKYVVIVAVIFFVLYLFNRYSILIATIWTFVAGIIFAYILNPLVKRIEKYNIKRSFAILIIYISIVMILVLLGMLVLPKTYEQLKQLLISLPGISRDLYHNASRFIDTLFNNYPGVKQIIKDTTSDFYNRLGDIRLAVLNYITQYGQDGQPGILTKIIQIVLIPIVTFYILLDKEKLIKQIIRMIPIDKKRKFLDICKDMDNAYSNFIRGRILMALFVGIVTMIFLLLVKVEFALIIGVLTFVGDIIPYIGPFIALLPAFILAFIQSPIKGILVVIVFVFIQWIENNVLAPKLLGSKVGVNPLAILFGLIIGGSIMGVWGMIFAVPIISTVTILYKHFKGNIKRFFYENQSEDR